MKDLPYKNKINPKIKALILILSLFIIGIIIGQVISNIAIVYLKEVIENLDINIGNEVKNRLISGYKWLVTLIVIDIILLGSLLWIYFNTYRKTKSGFIIGLNFFIIILLVKSVLSLAYLFSFFNESIKLLPGAIITLGTYGFGVIGFFINIFEIIAISILLYLSME